MKKVRFIFFIFIISNLLAIIIYAQSTNQIFDKFEKRYFAHLGKEFPYYLFIPEDYDSLTQYPLVLCLHGGPGVGDDSSVLMKNDMAIVWGRDSNQTRWPCFIFAPLCPLNDWWGNSIVMTSVNKILDYLTSEFSIDTNRLYVTGNSNGGTGTWRAIMHYPDKFAAAVPICGCGEPSKAILIKHISIWNFHGALDNTIPVSCSREMMAALENVGCTVVYTKCHNLDCIGLSDKFVADTIKKGAKILYTEYQYGGHSIWDQSYNNPLLLTWIFSQSKNQTPTGMIKEKNHSLPFEVNLLQNYPNPFNPTTTIKYSIPGNVKRQTSNVKLVVYDILGREIAVLVNEVQKPGYYKVKWDADGLSSGVYFYRITSGNFVETKKMILFK